MKIQLHTAFTWTCEECGQDNFERSVTLEPELVKATVAAEDQREIDRLKRAGIDVSGDWVTSPSEVKCKHCGAEFETE